MTNLRESHNAFVKYDNKPSIKKDDVIIIEEPILPRSNWKLARVHEVIVSKDSHIGGALVKVAKTKLFIKRPVNKLYLVKSHLETVKKRENKFQNIPQSRTSSKAAILSQLQGKYSP